MTEHDDTDPNSVCPVRLRHDESPGGYLRVFHTRAEGVRSRRQVPSGARLPLTTLGRRRREASRREQALSFQLKTAENEETMSLRDLESEAHLHGPSERATLSYISGLLTKAAPHPA